MFVWDEQYVAAEISAAREHGGLARAEAAMTVTEERVAGLEQMWAEEIRGIDERVTAVAKVFGLVDRSGETPASRHYGTHWISGALAGT